MNKIVFIDFGIFMFRAIFSWRKNRDIIPTYTTLNMILSSLAKVGINKEDKVIIAVDSPEGSWRRDLDGQYKSNRKENRESYEDIDWEYLFVKFNNMISRLDLSTPFNIITLPKIEADDIISVGVRFFSDKECIIISYDSDFEQLLSLKNVKIFSPLSKKYKIVKDPFKSLVSKINKESTDNLLTPVLNEQDFDTRQTLVNLLNLPEYIESEIEKTLKQLPEQKSYNIELFPFQSLIKRMNNLDNIKNIVKYSDSLKKKRKKGKQIILEE